jgi:hypothetical protein
MDTFTEFNTNIEEYSMDELFNLLSIKIDNNSNYEDIAIKIEKNSDMFIKTFSEMKKPEIVNFFNKVKKSLLGNNATLSTSEQIVLQYKNKFSPNVQLSPITDTTDMFNSNNGAGNPIHRKTVSKLLNIDSKFRDNYLKTTSSNYSIDLPYPINNVIELKLCDLELPSTYFPINVEYQNNYFWMYTKDISNNEIYYYIVIPSGNYYYKTIINNINIIFESFLIPFSISCDLNYSNLGGIGEGNGFSKIGIVDPINDVTSPFNSPTLPQIIYFELNFNASPLLGITNSLKFNKNNDINNYKNYYDISSVDYKQQFGWLIGFRKPKYMDAELTNSLLYYKSESIMDFTGSKYFFLIVDDFNKSMNVNFLSASVKGLLPDNIIARISLKGLIFSIQSQNDFSVYSEPRYYYGPVNINKLQVSLVDEYGRIVDLNQKDLSFTLRLTTIYSIT